MYINSYGCAEYTAGYYSPGSELEKITTGYGTFFLPVCYAPHASPILSSLVFTTFVLLCGFILVSLTVAFVTTGINNKLASLREEEEKEETRIERSGSYLLSKGMSNESIKMRRMSRCVVPKSGSPSEIDPKKKKIIVC